MCNIPLLDFMNTSTKIWRTNRWQIDRQMSRFHCMNWCGWLCVSVSLRVCAFSRSFRTFQKHVEYGTRASATSYERPLMLCVLGARLRHCMRHKTFFLEWRLSPSTPIFWLCILFWCVWPLCMTTQTRTHTHGASNQRTQMQLKLKA